jgi:hypothetical protein
MMPTGKGAPVFIVVHMNTPVVWKLPPFGTIFAYVRKKTCALSACDMRLNAGRRANEEYEWEEVVVCASHALLW